MTFSRITKPGFTLIELLVVISIISLLMSILLPSLSKARELAKRTQCASRLRAIYIASAIYVDQEGSLSPLNNQPNDGNWQYNYLIYDGEDFDNNFGPLIRGKILDSVELLYCPSQKDEFHLQNTQVNPWPEIRGLDSRAGYGRRYHLSGKKFSQIRKTIAFASDLLHLPKVVKAAHKKGVNAVYTDGHARWVDDPGIFTDNELTKPFEVTDNPIMRDIWDELDDAP